jgi:recombinational DNA repair ATPase RecF
MIQRVWLHNWKAYDSLDLSFEPGTTFLIAENGIGKSSIVQGIYFALFGASYMLGTDHPVTNAVRGFGQETGVAGCEILLGSHLVQLERAVSKTSRSSHTARITIDGQHASEGDWSKLLHAETGVDASQLALLAFVSEGTTTSFDDAGLSTIGMLAEVFGVSQAP